MSTTTEDPWTIGRVLSWAASDLRTRGSTSPRLDAELLLCHVLRCDRVELVIDGKRPLAPTELAAYRKLHQRRRRGEPVAYLRGMREFYGRHFVVDHRVLVPRPETELLVEVALARTKNRRLSARVLDLCTGSGCVAITLAKERPTTRVVASDISPEALEVACSNALRLGAQIGLVLSDGYDALQDHRGQLDLITANPPYIAHDDMASLPPDIRNFEPHLALAAGPRGLSVHERIASGAAQMLAPDGLLAVEVAAGQADEVRRLLRDAGLAELETARDYGGHERVVSARRPS